MNDRINKTSICSIVFLDLIDYSKKPDSEQIDVKNQFNVFINIALKDIAQNDRIILDTGDGVAIAYMGSPEDALFMALNIRDSIIKNNESGQSLIHVRFGINLGPVRVVKDINGRPNIIGDGINVAQRIMSFAQPNQILVSRSYYEITSRLTQEISKMFDYSGVKQDKHVREHEVYSVRLSERRATVQNQAKVIADNSPLKNQFAVFNKINWNYAAPAVFVLVTLFAIGKLAFAPSEPANISNIASKPAKAEVLADIKPTDEIVAINTPTSSELANTASKPAKVGVVAHAKPADDVLAINVPADLTLEQKKKLPEKQVSEKLSKKKAELKAKSLIEPVPERSDFEQKTHKTNEQTTKMAFAKIRQENPSREILSVSVKSNRVYQCSQAQVAMGQCN
jgi:hypothetical protein